MYTIYSLLKIKSEASNQKRFNVFKKDRFQSDLNTLNRRRVVAAPRKLLYTKKKQSKGRRPKNRMKKYLISYLQFLTEPIDYEGV